MVATSLLLALALAPSPLDTVAGPEEVERRGAEAATMWPVTKLLDRVWRRTDGDGPPGVMRIFLRDGTLLSDSCWETYRLSRWSALPGGIVVWSEDGVDVRAVVEELTEDELVLRLELPSGAEAQRFAPAEAPWVCPDLPR
jgi:hypothetical protein